MSRENKGTAQGKSGGYKEPKTKPQKNVCEECGYYDSHSPDCSKGKT